MDLDLADLTVLVTGASGGIGRAVADAFLAEGAFVACLARTGADRLRTEMGDRPRTVVLEADVRRPSHLAAAVDTLLGLRGRVDVAVPCAGIWPSEDAGLHALSEPRVREVVETNLLGVLWTARAFLAALARTGPRVDGRGASIVLVGSTAGRFGERGHVDYAATKGALRAVTLSLKNEIVDLDPAGRVNLVEPGWTVTPMTAEALEDPALVRRVTRTASLERIGDAGDVAGAILYLASPSAARHVTGEILTVAGGMEGRVLRE
jgi:3-oxoacyl-[acyl-carrier protein] reductase